MDQRTRSWRRSGGDVGALQQYWHGNIFHPSRADPRVLGAPRRRRCCRACRSWRRRGNVVLVYNLLFLSTFVLSGLGTFLLVRELTKRPRAAFVAGLAFAFAPYRISQFSHLQVLSAQWMPFALYGFHRYFDVRPHAAARRGERGARRAEPVVRLLPAVLLAVRRRSTASSRWPQRGLLRSLRTWRALLLAAAGVGLVDAGHSCPRTWRCAGTATSACARTTRRCSSRRTSMRSARRPTRRHSGAVVIRAFPRGEGELFAGLTVLAFATIALLAGAAHAHRPAPPRGRPSRRRWALRPRRRRAGARDVRARLDAARRQPPNPRGGTALAGFDGALRRGAGRRRPAGGTRAARAPRAARGARLRPGLLCRRRRRDGAPRARSARAVGRPVARLRSVPIVLYAFVPGFDGVRVPARFFMVTALFLSVLAGLGAAWLLARARRAGLVVVALGSALVLAESWVGPMPTNVRLDARGYEFTPRRLDRADTMSPLYRTVRDTARHGSADRVPLRRAGVRHSRHATTPASIAGRSSTATPASSPKTTYAARRFSRTSRSTWTPPPEPSNPQAPPTPSSTKAPSGRPRPRSHRLARLDRRHGHGHVRLGQDADARARAASEQAPPHLRISTSPHHHITTSPHSADFTHAPRSALAYLTTELDTLRQQGLYRTLRVLDGRQQATAPRSTAARSSTSRRTTTSA